MQFFKIILVSIVMILCFGVTASEVQYGVVYSKGSIEGYKKPIPKSEWNESTKLWLGRSCVGEAGFDAHDECIGIAWVYSARYRELGGKVSLERIIRKYSAAVKDKSTHRRPWILSLNLKGDRPDRWPSKLSWKTHRPKWVKILSELDHWASGDRSNPVRGANHYGGKMDHPGESWVRIKPVSGMKFRNIFYRSTF